MIERYTREKMGSIWKDENRFKKWLDVECAVLSVLEKNKIIPDGVAREISSKTRINVAEILKLEKTLKHDVIAFTTSVANQNKKFGKYFHYGLTSSDVVDTALVLLVQDSLKEISKGLDALIASLKTKAQKYKSTPCIGRTHGVHAEPTSFGLKFLSFHEEFKRHQDRLSQIKNGFSFGKISGAVGAYGVLSPAIEEDILKKLGLKPEPVSTQILPRDRHAELLSVLAGIGNSIERVCVEIRHLSRTEVFEMLEEFTAGQKGSSAMPHKRNPVGAENLSGCARLLRGYMLASHENVALWHERDISHSSVERVILPDSTILLDYMLSRLTKIVSGLQINEKNIALNLKRTQRVYFSGHLLLKCVEKGMEREDAYPLIQKAALNAWDKGNDFMDEVLKVPKLARHFSRKELDKVFDVRNYLKHVDAIYKRALS